MSKIAPNNRCEILINDFIALAKQHLLTIKGQAVCTSQNASGATIPSIVLWTGYTCEPETPITEDDFPVEIQKVEFKSTNELSLVEQEFYKDDIKQVYGVSYPTEVETAPVFGGVNPKTSAPPNTTKTAFVASGTEARKVAEKYLGRPLSDEEWNTFIALIFAESGRDQNEEGHVAATILNRVRWKFTPAGIAASGYKFDTVMDIAWQRRQYEAVTGKPPDNKPSKWFLQGPSKYRTIEIGIYGAIVNVMPTVSIYLTDFTANNDCLYVKCNPPGKGLEDVIRPIQRIFGRDYSILTSRRLPPYNGVVVGSTIFSISRVIINARNKGLIP